MFVLNKDKDVKFTLLYKTNQLLDFSFIGERLRSIHPVRILSPFESISHEAQTIKEPYRRQRFLLPIVCFVLASHRSIATRNFNTMEVRLLPHVDSQTMKNGPMVGTSVLNENPQHVFDLSLIQGQDERSIANCEGNDEKSLSVHPLILENLTMYITDDDNTSVSSVSTQGSLQRRSMFSQYWKNTGQEAPRYVPRSSCCGKAASPVSSPNRDGPAERGVLATPPEHEAVVDVCVPSMTAASSENPVNPRSLQRRTMFTRGNHGIRPSSSAPSLSFSNHKNDDTPTSSFSSSSSSGFTRKTRSYSYLLPKQPCSSCLRESRFSLKKSNSLRRNSSTTSATSSATDSASVVSGSSVRFDMAATSVRHFDIPQEHYAEEGWSNFFQ